MPTVPTSVVRVPMFDTDYKKYMRFYSKQSRDRKGAVTALVVIQRLTAGRTGFL